jgi:class 3 adenylate cyclase
MDCRNCRISNPEGAKFCLNCGTALEAARPVEGERKFVTVLFADVVDSTAIGKRLDPEQVIEIMNGAFAFLNMAVTKYDGTVARLMGDAVLAFLARRSHTRTMRNGRCVRVWRSRVRRNNTHK